MRLQRPNGELRNILPTILEYRYFSRSIFKLEEWRKVAHLVSKEESVIQKSHSERSVIEKFSGKNLDLCLCCVFVR